MSLIQADASLLFKNNTFDNIKNNNFNTENAGLGVLLDT